MVKIIVQDGGGSHPCDERVIGMAVIDHLARAEATGRKPGALLSCCCPCAWSQASCDKMLAIWIGRLSVDEGEDAEWLRMMVKCASAAML